MEGLRSVLRGSPTEERSTSGLVKQDASRIIRRVRESGEEMAVTVRGEVVALLVPVRAPRRKRARSPWTEIDALAREIARHWPKGTTAAEAVREQRR